MNATVPGTHLEGHDAAMIPAHLTHAPTFLCSKHGRIPWRGEIQCRQCGAVYTTHKKNEATHAPARCACGTRLLPKRMEDILAGGAYFSASPCCSQCFVEGPDGFEVCVHAPRSPECPGAECKFHGPQLRKLARRAAAATHAADARTQQLHAAAAGTPPRTHQLQVPGTLGLTTFVEQPRR